MLRPTFLVAWVSLLPLASTLAIAQPNRTARPASSTQSPGTKQAEKPVADKDTDAAAQRSLMDQVDAAWSAMQWKSLDSIMENGFKTQYPFMRDRMRAMLEKNDQAARPFAAAMLARHAHIEDLAQIASQIPTTTFRDERRLLVRSIGHRAVPLEPWAFPDHGDLAKAAAGMNSFGKPIWASADPEKIDAAYGALREFVTDRDPLVAAAAVTAYSDLGRPEAIAMFADKVADVPSVANSSSLNERLLLSRAVNSAFERLTRERPKQAAEIKSWARDHGVDGRAARQGAKQPDKKQSADSDAKPETAPGGAAAAAKAGDQPLWLGKEDSWNGQKYRASKRFNLFYRVGREGEPDAGELAFDEIAPLMELAARAAEEATAPLFGRVAAPAARLFLCDPQQFSAKAKNGFFAGVTNANEIVLRVESARMLPMVMWHEYIHWIHNANYADQPRWISEGVADSYSLSMREPVSRRMAAAQPKVMEIVGRGAFTEMLNWNAGGSSDSMEGARYRTSHLCIDFLRYGEFSVADTRLAFLMGRLSRRENARAAIESLYGMEIRELDEKLRAWVKAS